MYSIVSGFLLYALTAIRALPFTQDSADEQKNNFSPIHLFIARGTTEPPGDGMMHSLAQRIIADLGSERADREAIDYPATGLGEYTAYMDSVRKGSEAIALQVTNYASRCPTSKLVLLGYSQCAQIIGDALCGTELTSASLGGSASDPSEGPTSTSDTSIILIYLLVSAIVLYGDPSFRTGEPYDKGTSTSSGSRPPGSCQFYAPLIRSYYDTKDAFCASGQSDIVHTGYFIRYNSDAANFVNSLVT
ncbi:cutinase [Aspergillus novoparasiticus]|uniref:Cutinase n=1 Tax=Aspergillus novoparasiticus TaxID=986946 RepID=A0A5N6E667_9EURO|nr:cutinase [Aspergillus novoparasiticus]